MVLTLNTRKRVLLVTLALVLCCTLLLSSITAPSRAFLEVLTVPETVPLFLAFLGGLGITLDGLSDNNWTDFSDWALDRLNGAVNTLIAMRPTDFDISEDYEDIVGASAITLAGSNVLLPGKLGAVMAQAARDIQLDTAGDNVIIEPTVGYFVEFPDGVLRTYAPATFESSRGTLLSGTATDSWVRSNFDLSTGLQPSVPSSDGKYLNTPWNGDIRLEVTGTFPRDIYNQINGTWQFNDYYMSFPNGLDNPFLIVGYPYTPVGGQVQYRYSVGIYYSDYSSRINWKFFPIAGNLPSALPAPPGEGDGDGLVVNPDDSIPAPVPSTWGDVGTTQVGVALPDALSEGVNSLSGFMQKLKEAFLTGDIDNADTKVEVTENETFNENGENSEGEQGDLPLVYWPKGGNAFLGIWRYVQQALADSAAGIGWLFATIHIVFPSAIVNMMWACVVLAIMFGVYQKFIK